MKKIISIILAFVMFYFIMSINAEELTQDTETALQIIKKAIKDDIYNIHKIDKGSSNSTLFKVDTYSKSYVVKFFSQCSDEVFLNIEVYSAKLFSDYLIGPKVYLIDKNHKAIFMEFIEHGIITKKMRYNKELYKKLGKFLRNIHTVKSHLPKRSITEDISIKFHLLADKKKISKSTENTLLETMNNILNLDTKMELKNSVTSHCDLHPGNMIFTKGKFIAIDGSMLALSDPYYDIATIAIWWCFSNDAEKCLLKTYLGRDAFNVELEKLAIFKKMVMFRSILDILYTCSNIDEEVIFLSEYKQISLLDFLISCKEQIDSKKKMLTLASILLRIIKED